MLTLNLCEYYYFVLSINMLEYHYLMWSLNLHPAEEILQSNPLEHYGIKIKSFNVDWITGISNKYKILIDTFLISDEHDKIIVVIHFYNAIYRHHLNYIETF